MAMLAQFMNVLRPLFLSRRRPRASQRIHLLPAGLELIDLRTRKSLWRFDWRDVKEIITFKSDAYVIDHICIGFRTFDVADYFVAYEDQENWNQLIDFLQTQFSIDWPRCYIHVLHPPFAANRTTIWGIPWPAPCSNCNYDLRGWPKICPECGRPVEPPSLLPRSND